MSETFSRENSYVADPKLAHRMAFAFFRHTTLSVRTIIFLSALLLIGVAVVLLIGKDAGQRVVLVSVVLVGALAIGLVWRANYRKLITQFAQAMAPGATLTVELGDESITITTALGTSTTNYVAYDGISAHDGAVLLKQRDSGIFYVHPIELFPGDSVEFVRERIRLAKPVA